jgi:hypothetical protein
VGLIRECGLRLLCLNITIGRHHDITMQLLYDTNKNANIYGIYVLGRLNRDLIYFKTRILINLFTN